MNNKSVAAETFLIGFLTCSLCENELNENEERCVRERCVCENILHSIFDQGLMSIDGESTDSLLVPVTSSMPLTNLTFDLHPPFLPPSYLSFPSFLPSFSDHAARSEAQKGAACFSKLGTVVML